MAGDILANKMDWKKLMLLTIDALTMLSNANTLTNQLRRDLLKPNIQPRLQLLCKTGKEVDTTELLFGTNLADRVKVATESGKLGRRILPTSGMYPTGTYAGGLRGRRALAQPYYYPSYGMPSNRGYPGGRGRPFLGKSHTLLEPKISMRQSSENTRAANLWKLTSVTICYNFKIFSNISPNFSIFTR